MIRCAPECSVSLTIIESDGDFDNLVRDHARDANQFYDFIPQLPPISDESDCKLFPVLAIQVTLFPGRGMCIGLTNLHVVGDASSIVGFILSWANVCRHGGHEEGLTAEGNSLPTFDRSLVNEPSGASSFFWNIMRQIPLQPAPFPLPTNGVRATYVLGEFEVKKFKVWNIMRQIPLQPAPFPLPTNGVRATYVLGEFEVKKFKELLLARKPGVVHISSFVVTAAYVWSCPARSLVVAGEDEKIEDNADEIFLFAIDGRARLDPPVPGNYFGNCILYGLGKTRHQELTGEEGFFVAAEAIATEIQKRVNDKKKLLKDFENWMAEVRAARQKRILWVTGSAKVHVYNADFGWGKARNMETLSIDGHKYAMSLCKSRDAEGGLEIGLSLPKVVMDAFAAAFANGLC